MLRFLSRFLGLVLLSGLALAPRDARATSATSTSRAATPAEISMLNDVLHKVAADYSRWAYTEHRIIRDAKGRVKSETLLRHDPSLPYAEQWVPLKIDGREPTQRERDRYRRQGERSAPAGGPVSGNTAGKRKRPSLGESIDVARAFIDSETASHLVFEIPLLKTGDSRFPPEKFQVLARIRKEGHLLENISVRLRGSYRSKLVLKVKSGDASLDFSPVDARFPPALVRIEGDADASVVFVSVGGALELKRTELKHVKPFDERFEVQIGGLKAIDF